jgi:dolichyl-phosphate-mannose-protein mannosyltransferase
MDKQRIKRLKLLIFLSSCLLCVMMFFLSASAMFRDLWFDEALTVTTYTSLPNIVRIYFNYLIPNNHIIYTIFLKYWIQIWMPIMGHNNFAYRLPSFIFGFTALIFILIYWRRRLGTMPAFLTALCFTCSLPFAIYAVAVRGYILCFLLVMLAFEAAMLFNRYGKKKYAVYYFIATILAVGTIPSSLIAFVAIVLYLMGRTATKQYFKPRNIVIALIPPIALLIFYLPITGMFVNSMMLKEGWHNSARSMLTLYAGFTVAMLPLLLFNLVAVRRIFGRLNLQKTLFTLAIFILPLLFYFRTPAPFPRLFFPLWPIWIFIVGRGTKHAFAMIVGNREKMLNLFTLTIVITSLIFGYGLATRAVRDKISAVVVNGTGLDDYFSPYYARSTFQPTNMIKSIKKETNNNPPPIYISFNSSPYSFIFHGVLHDVPKHTWYFDNPDYKIRELPPQSFAILCKRDNPQDFIKHYKVRKMTMLQDFGYHQLYLVEI